MGLLTTIRIFQRWPVPLQTVAAKACHIDPDILRKPLGKQDQYMATFAGLLVVEISPSGSVRVEPIQFKPHGRTASPRWSPTRTSTILT